MMESKKKKNMYDVVLEEKNYILNCGILENIINNDNSLLDDLKSFNSKLNYSEILSNEIESSKEQTISNINKIFENSEKGFKILNEMFYNCSSLTSLQGISKMNTNNAKSVIKMFQNCES